MNRRKYLLLICFSTGLPVLAEDIATPDKQTGNISGTVPDVYGDILPGASITPLCATPCEAETQTSNNNAAFSFNNLRFGIPNQIRIAADGFENREIPTIVLAPDSPSFLATGIKLRIANLPTTITVHADTTQITTEQVHFEMQQRVPGIIPNIYTVYDSQNAVPLTVKLNYQLALKVSADPVTLAGVAFMAGVRQTAHNPDYVLGAKGYGQRMGAEAADGFSDILTGGAILPPLLHQDSRYFYQGAGTAKSRLAHALSSPFVCKGDSRRWQPNYSSVVGDLAAAL
jgi:hypothetical protein